MGTIGKQSDVLLHVQCRRPAAEPHPRHQDAEGGLGKPEEGLRREHHGPEAATPTGVEQCLTKGHVGGGLHGPDQRDL